MSFKYEILEFDKKPCEGPPLQCTSCSIFYSWTGFNGIKTVTLIFFLTETLSCQGEIWAWHFLLAANEIVTIYLQIKNHLKKTILGVHKIMCLEELIDEKDRKGKNS